MTIKYEEKTKYDMTNKYDMKKLGVLPNDKEWELELPNQV